MPYSIEEKKDMVVLSKNNTNNWYITKGLDVTPIKKVQGTFFEPYFHLK